MSAAPDCKHPAAFVGDRPERAKARFAIRRAGYHVAA